ncbi:MAG: hypothetical protein O3B02_07885 [Proteobacteria bacterium]|nr:hypothetical protein [Pseudomonadota bacterium]MDA1244906.1 hypothetical protein [Pseudomonadota bacterium]
MSDQNGASGESAVSSDQPRVSEQTRVRAEQLKQQYELRQRPEGFYLSDGHFERVNEAVEALRASKSLVFVSENYEMAKHYKELCIARLRNDPALRLLSFDPLSGPDLLSIINAQIKETSLEEILSSDRAHSLSKSELPRSVLIVDNEDLVAETDWHLIATLASQLANATIGVLRLEPRDRFSARPNSANLSSSLSIEFDLPSEREIQILEALSKHSPKGEEVLRLIDELEFVRSTPKLSDSDLTPQVSDEEAAEIRAKGPAAASDSESTREESKSLDQSVTTSNEVAHLSFRLFLGLIVVEAFLIAAYFNQ